MSSLPLLVKKTVQYGKMAAGTYDIKLSMDVSIGFVLRDLRKDDSPGVKAIDVDGMAHTQL